jgi:glycosyltransferase involved in cell wall biosynthesis
MRILQVITSLQTGGAETLVCNMTSRLRALGHDVDLCVFNGVETPLMKRMRDEEGVKVYSLGSSYYNPYYILKLMGIMRQYDIVHTHNSSPQLFAAIANIVCRKKLVTTEHSTNNRKREQGGVLRILDKWMYRQYDSVVCISDIAERKLRDYLAYPRPLPEGKGDEWAHHDNIKTIHNGVDVEALHHAVPISRKDIGSDDSKFVVVMVAGFREAKDQDTLIRAMNHLDVSEYELWLVGDGVRRECLESVVDSLKLRNNVRFLGLRTDVPNILKAADVVVMSSHWEGLSLSNIEGMSVGKPFVASDVNGLREVTQGSGLLFPHGDDKALADLIRQLHDDKLYYQQVADKCYERARQFDISKMVEAYNKIYEGLKN